MSFGIFIYQIMVAARTFFDKIYVQNRIVMFLTNLKLFMTWYVSGAVHFINMCNKPTTTTTHHQLYQYSFIPDTSFNGDIQQNTGNNNIILHANMAPVCKSVLIASCSAFSSHAFQASRNNQILQNVVVITQNTNAPSLCDFNIKRVFMI